MNLETNYNVLDWNRVHVIRLVLQTRTPLSIGQGSGDGIFDNLLVTDANGLAAIPGTSFAGVLRHLYQKEEARDDTGQLFGNGGENASPSRLRVSWGCIHDQNDKPVDRLLLGENLERLEQDPLLRDAAQEAPLRRDRVRINHRGTACDGGQFDRVALRAGHRFSIELCLWQTDDNQTYHLELLKLMTSPQFRLGGGTRSGFGGLEIIRIHHRFFNLEDRPDFNAYALLSPDLDNTSGFEQIHLPEAEEMIQVRVKLIPEDFFRFGQGQEPLEIEGDKGQGTRSDKEPGLLPLSESRVVWDLQDRGRLSEKALLIPASAVKGALRHRVAYHYHCLKGFFADDQTGALNDSLILEQNPAVKALFGCAADDENGEVGAVLIDDLQIAPAQKVHLTHNGIDRFTGGVREHVLYTEEVVSVPDLTLTLALLPKNIPHKARKALALTLEDLAEGRLALGAGSARGHGYFQGDIEWNQAGADWLNGGES